MNSQVIASLCVGPDPAYRLCVSLQKAYAKRYGHDYVLFEDEVFRARPNWIKKRRVGFHLEKFQVLTLLEKYERVFFMDADVIPSIQAPDLFAVVGSGFWGCVPEPPSANDWKFAADLCKFEKRLGKLPDTSPGTYFNSGILVFDRAHSPIWEWKREEVLSSRWPEQTLLNYRIQKSRTSVQFLDWRYNFTPQVGEDWKNEQLRRSQFFIHYASQPAKQLLQKDLEFHLEQWETLAG